MRSTLALPILPVLLAVPAAAVDSPWISDTYFYWYSWDGPEKLGAWMGGVYNTPLSGYYDSRSVADNTQQLHTASEWGLTHHFMDYWGPGWQGEDGGPRETILMRATEAVRAAGYPIFMSVYQDGEDFDMAEFARNLDPGRDAHFYFDLFGRHEAFPKIGGKPAALIYARNGVPKQSVTDETFRAAMQAKYGTLAALNARWGTGFTSFDEVKLDFGAGFPRYESIKHQYAVWQAEWERTNAAAQRLWGLPGVLCSFDIAYQPFRGWGYSDMNRVFLGPHSYAGIFGRPEAEGTERFIQAQVAKAYGGLFFDTFKNFYHDWEIRLPGITYVELFDAFDRFWVNVLLNKSEALLHLSWNEWWEGSNLEPCLEYGKLYGEKNLLWASVMQQCFPSIRDWNQGARVAVLLNDWHWYAGANSQDDIYGCIEALRRGGAVFDLLADDHVTAEKLAQFEVIVAPAAGVGLGFNAAGEPILPLLRQWVEGVPGRKLILSRVPGGVDPASGLSVADWLLLRPWQGTAAATAPGDDMNLFVDVGTAGDDDFLISGATFHEDWGRLPAESYGARAEAYTVRWTPGVGNQTLFVVPLSPHREHIVRFGGSVLWDNSVRLLLNGVEVATVDVVPGDSEYEATIPAAAVGDATTGELVFEWRQSHIPSEREPERFPTEARVCNLALDYLQVATAGTPLSRQNNYRIVQHGVRSTDAAPASLRGEWQTGYTRRDRLAGGTALTVNSADGSPRDMLIEAGEVKVWYCDGLLGAVEDPSYLDGILAWAGVTGEFQVTGRDIAWSTLKAGDTTVVLLDNQAATERRDVRVTAPAGELPLAEVRAISRNGREFAGLFEPSASIRDQLSSYGAYTFVRSAVRVITPSLDVLPGETRTIGVELTNLTDAPARGALGNGWHLPSLRVEPATFELAPRETKTVPLTIVARDDCDWGRKTIVLDLEANGRHSFLWRPVRVWKPAVIELAGSVVFAEAPVVTLRRPRIEQGVGEVSDGTPLVLDESELCLDPTGIRVELPELGLSAAAAGALPAGATAAVELTGPLAIEPGLRTVTGVVRWRHRQQEYSVEVPLHLARPPAAAPRVANATRVAWVVNPADVPVEGRRIRLPGETRSCWSAEGRPLPLDRQGRLTMVLVDLPARSMVPVCLSDEPAEPTGDLTVTSTELGTGRGTVTAANSYLRVTWSEAAGGTITELTTRWDGVDHAAPNCGGIAWGRWGQFQPAQPTMNAVDFLRREEKQFQASSPARIQVVEGRTEVAVRVDWASGGARAAQRYYLPAYQPLLRYEHVASLGTPPAVGEELVVADFNFRRGEWNKIYPNFTGITEQARDGGPHGGWREGDHVPEVATLMQNPSFGGSLSSLVTSIDRVDKFRQGFWPPDRPDEGPIDFARLEYVATASGSAAVEGYLLFHEGHQNAALQHLARDAAAGASFVTTPQWLPAPAAGPPLAADWWNAGYERRARFAVGPFAAAMRDPVVSLPLPADGIDPDSVRAIADGRLLTHSYRPDEGELVVRLPGDRAVGAGASVDVYYDTGPGRKPALQWSSRLPGGSLSDPGFERRGAGWQVQAPGEFARGEAHGGEGYAIIQRTEGMGPVVLQTASKRIVPNATYRLSFWARTTDRPMYVYTNVYHPLHDAPAARLELNSDGAWHRYQVDLPSGDFSPDLGLVLRFWILDQAGGIAIDDVELSEVGAPAGATIPVRLLNGVAR